MIHILQVIILSLILSWCMYKLSEMPSVLVEILGAGWLQKRKNLALSLATKRDPLTEPVVTHQGA